MSSVGRPLRRLVEVTVPVAGSKRLAVVILTAPTEGPSSKVETLRTVTPSPMAVTWVCTGNSWSVLS